MITRLINHLLEKDDSVAIHHKNIQAVAIEIYKTMKNLNPAFMKEIFSLKPHNYPLRTQNRNPRTVPYGTYSFGYKGSQIWKNITKEIQKGEDIFVVKSYLSRHYKDLCKCFLDITKIFVNANTTSLTGVSNVKYQM